MEPNPPAARRPAWRRSAFYVALLLALGVVFWLTWQAFQSHQAGDWTYSQLVVGAQDHQVTRLVITGSQGIATDVHGREHRVNLPADTTPTATLLASEGVQVVYEGTQDNLYLLQVLVPNLILLALIGGVVFFVVRAARRQPPRGPS